MSAIQFHNFLILLVIVMATSSCQPNVDSKQVHLCDKNDVISSKLIAVQEVKKFLNNNQYAVAIEVSKDEEYYSGHISNALHVWRPDFRSKVFSNYGGMMCSKNELETFLQNLGVNDDTHFLIYDNKGGCDAMRLAWVFDFYGFKDYHVINGGKAAWVQAGFDLDTTEVVPIPNTDFILSTVTDSSFVADRFELLAALSDTNTVIVDTREAYEFLGEPFMAEGKVWSHKKGAFSRGCIPGAVHLNWSEMSDLADDHRIKCTKDLLYNLKEKGIDKHKKVIVYCQSGSRSSHTAFVLREILKYPEVKNYDGSWIEWSYYFKNGGQLPISKLTSDEKFMELELELLKKGDG